MRAWMQWLRAWMALIALYVSPVTAETWSEVLPIVRRRFPGVRQISTRELAEWLASKDREHPLLVDARTEEEYGVSHLAGARRAGDVESVRRLATDATRPIVVYCSVGYRSSALAERLQRAGFTKVFNLEGSIFAWANEQRPLWRGKERVEVVHPFDAKWGQLLDQRWHAGAGGRE
jgi:rhodanese-related sulfurtransferase